MAEVQDPNPTAKGTASELEAIRPGSYGSATSHNYKAALEVIRAVLGSASQQQDSATIVSSTPR